MKNVLILSTRTTAIGTFRKDSLHELDDRDHRVAAVIKTLTEGERPAARILTDKEVKDRNKKAKSFVPKPEGKKAEVKVKEAQAGEAAANERAEKAEVEAAEKAKVAEEALDREKTALADAETNLKLAEDTAKEVDKLKAEKDGLADQLASAKADLEKLKKASAK